GGDGAAGGAVVGGIDAIHLVAECGERLSHLLLGFVGRPIGGVIFFGDGDLAVEDGVSALFEEGGIVVGGRAIDHDDGRIGLAAEGLQEGLALQFADLFIVKGDVIVDSVGAFDEAVIGDDGDVFGFRQIGDGSGGVRVHWVEDEHLGAVGESGFGLLLLCGGVLIGVGIDEVVGDVKAEGLEFVFEIGQVLRFVARRFRFRQQNRNFTLRRGA